MRNIATISATDEGTTVQGVDIDEAGRRSQIVRAAAAVLGRQGYAETSLKDVAREAKVAPGLLHYYFELEGRAPPRGRDRDRAPDGRELESRRRGGR